MLGVLWGPVGSGIPVCCFVRVLWVQSHALLGHVQPEGQTSSEEHAVERRVTELTWLPDHSVVIQRRL